MHRNEAGELLGSALEVGLVNQCGLELVSDEDEHEDGQASHKIAYHDPDSSPQVPIDSVD